jgi:hypothetical protein
VSGRTPTGLGGTEIGGRYGEFALAHDGTLIVARDPSDARARLVLRRLDRPGTVPIEGTELGVSPFISWGARLLGFVRGGEIFVVPLEGGVAALVPNARTGAVGAPDWTPDGRIVFSDSLGRLAVVGTDGTGLAPLTTPSGAGGHVSPRVLANGEWVLFTLVKDRFRGTGSSQMAVVSLQTKEVRVVVDRDAGFAALSGWAAQLRR